MQESAMLLAAQGHPNILKFHGIWQLSTSRWVLTMERCYYGDLYMHLSRYDCSEGHLRQVISGVMDAMEHIHSRGIIHRDVKPENILMVEDDQPVLADFGIACHVSDRAQMKKSCGSPGYAAPELIKSQQYCAKLDCFSLGCLIYYCYSGTTPFHGNSKDEICRSTCHDAVRFDSPLFEMTSDVCKRLIVALLEKDPKRRPSVREALTHEWLTMDINELEARIGSPEYGRSPVVRDSEEFARRGSFPNQDGQNTVDVAHVGYSTVGLGKSHGAQHGSEPWGLGAPTGEAVERAEENIVEIDTGDIPRCRPHALRAVTPRA
eukprot:UN1319